MSKRAEEAWFYYEYREHPKGLYYTCYVDGYEQAEKDTIERIIAWLDKNYVIVGRNWVELKKALEEE